jgi:hypothetical protein
LKIVQAVIKARRKGEGLDRGRSGEKRNRSKAAERPDAMVVARKNRVKFFEPIRSSTGIPKSQRRARLVAVSVSSGTIGAGGWVKV